MKKPIKSLIGIIFASLSMATAIGVSSFKSVNKEVEVAEAATGMKRIFLDCTQHGDYDKEQSIGIQYYTGSYIKKEATKLADNYWYVDVPSTNLTKIQFFRCDTGNVNNNYNWQWEGNPASVNYYSVKGWDNNGDWSNANGADESYELASTTPSTSTKRIWVDPKDHFYDGNARAGLRVFNGGTHYKTYILGGSSQYVNMTHEGSTQYFFYVDIPVNYDCQLVRLHNAFNTIWTYSGNFSDDSGYNTTKIMYSWDAAASLSAGYIDSDSNLTVEYAQKLLDGYSTCVNSDVNGYGAYSNLNTGVLSKLGSSKLSTLRSSTFSCSYGTRTYGEKIDRMASPNAGSRNPFIVVEQNKNGIIIIATVTSVVAITALVGYFLLKKRKEQ